LILNIRKSLRFTAIVLGAHSGALLLIFVLPIAPWQKFGFVALIGASLWWQGRYGIGASACEIRLEEDGSCTRTANGESRRYRSTHASSHPGFVCLTLKRAGERTRIQLVPRDAVDPEIYRTLRARIVQRRLPVPDKTPA
jgi:predicted alpha/beta superfamily hydrolase